MRISMGLWSRRRDYAWDESKPKLHMPGVPFEIRIPSAVDTGALDARMNMFRFLHRWHLIGSCRYHGATRGSPKGDYSQVTSYLFAKSTQSVVDGQRGGPCVPLHTRLTLVEGNGLCKLPSWAKVDTPQADFTLTVSTNRSLQLKYVQKSASGRAAPSKHAFEGGGHVRLQGSMQSSMQRRQALVFHQIWQRK